MHFLVPFKRDKGFVKREDILSKISQRLKERNRATLAGIGGIGKSQIAIEYCYRFREENPATHVLWVHASTQQRIIQEFRLIAKKLQVPDSDDPGKNIIEAVFKWLDDNDQRWLLVLDNADDLDVMVKGEFLDSQPIAQLLPRSLDGYILITTRDERVGRQVAGGHPVRVPRMTEQESRLLLGSNLEMDDNVEDGESSKELLENLDYIPLAIKTATSYINTMETTIREYLKIYKSRESAAQTLLASREDFDDRRDASSLGSILQTWILSFEQLTTRAAALLSIMSIFDQYRLPGMLLIFTNEPQTSFRMAVEELRSFAFISVHGEDVYDMHRLVRISTHKWLEQQDLLENYSGQALWACRRSFPTPSWDNLDICSALIPHALRVAQMDVFPEDDQGHLATLHSRMAIYFSKQGLYNQALQHHSTAWAIRNRVLGPERRITLLSWSGVALALKHLGRYDEAAKEYAQCVQAMEHALGPEHENTLNTLRDYGETLTAQGRYTQAEDIHRKCLEASNRTLGPEHLTTMAALSSLASDLDHRGKDEEAVELMQKCTALAEKIYGPEHPHTLASLNNLGLSLNHLGRHEESETIFRDCLATETKIHGPEHHLTMRSIFNLGSTLRARAKLEEAAVLMREYLRLKEKFSETQHPDYFNAKGHMGCILGESGNFDEAEVLLAEAHEGLGKMLGYNHPSACDAEKGLCAIRDLIELSYKRRKLEAFVATLPHHIQLEFHAGSYDRDDNRSNSDDEIWHDCEENL